MKLDPLKMLFLPLYSTVVLQLIDQVVIRSFKKHFRKRFVKCMLLNLKKRRKTEIGGCFRSYSYDYICLGNLSFKKAEFATGDITKCMNQKLKKMKGKYSSKNMTLLSGNNP